VLGIVYPPQVALVGFGRIRERPWVEAGQLGARPQVTASLAADHRASDGYRGGRFLAAVAAWLQKPEEL
jgi:pyruvate dehydrogenase E2 component (dihydrolipoamide acetyltransferase)